MQAMQRASVISLNDARRRSARVAQAIDARRRLRPSRRPRGRVWLNGAELGPADAAFSYLTESYD